MMEKGVLKVVSTSKPLGQVKAPVATIAAELRGLRNVEQRRQKLGTVRVTTMGVD